MDVQTVTMDQEAAQTAFKEYRAAFMAERNRIDGELMRGYKALAQGKTLISLADAIQRGGVDEWGRPHLAIARADEDRISMHRQENGAVEYTPWANERNAADRIFTFERGTLPVREWIADDPGRGRWFAMLPFIPPQYRPPHGLVNYHLLWEAEWRRAVGPQRRDPMLLKRVGGDLFAVVAAWDLTEVEKLVLAR